MENKQCGITFFENLKSRRINSDIDNLENRLDDKLNNKEMNLDDMDSLIANSNEAYLMDELYAEQLGFQLEEITTQVIDENLVENNNIVTVDDPNEINKLKYELEFQKKRIEEKEQEINYLKSENLDQKIIISDFHQTLMREQEIVMKEQDLHEKTLSRAEQLLLDKREELIERQNYKKRNWFLKLFERNRI